MNLGTATVIRGDARHLPLADNSVDLVVTSPPYFALRSYQDGGSHYAGQIGSEPTPAEFVAALLEVTRECARVLKPCGSLWVNLGDKYAQAEERSRNGNGNRVAIDNFTSGSVLGKSCNRCGSDTPLNPCPYSDVPCAPRFTREKTVTLGRKDNGVPRKSLIGIPWRYALACIDDLGLILRAEVIWSKPNGLPESVTDRVRRSHEQWFHFTLSPRYFSAVDEIRERHVTSDALTRVRTSDYAGPMSGAMNGAGNPLGKLPGSVWTDQESGDSLIRSVLAATAAGALTIEEGERILWTGARNSGPRSRSTTTTIAGTGPDHESPQGTGKSTSPDAASSGRTGLSTNSSPDPSATDSLSTTSAATSGASTPTTSSPSPSQRTSAEHGLSGRSASAGTASQTPTSRSRATAASTDGAQPATASDSVWVVPTEPLRVPEHLGIDHFAAFPTEFPRRIIQGWSPSGICTACCEGRRPITSAEYRGVRRDKPKDGDFHEAVRNVQFATGKKAAGESRIDAAYSITGYLCACPDTTAPTRPATILDPFGGTGTVAMVAKALGRNGVSVDMSADYCRLAEWRTNDRDQLAKVLGIEKAPAVPEDQLSIFDMEETA